MNIVENSTKGSPKVKIVDAINFVISFLNDHPELSSEEYDTVLKEAYLAKYGDAMHAQKKLSFDKVLKRAMNQIAMSTSSETENRERITKLAKKIIRAKRKFLEAKLSAGLIPQHKYKLNSYILDLVEEGKSGQEIADELTFGNKKIRRKYYSAEMVLYIIKTMEYDQAELDVDDKLVEKKKRPERTSEQQYLKPNFKLMVEFVIKYLRANPLMSKESYRTDLRNQFMDEFRRGDNFVDRHDFEKVLEAALAEIPKRRQITSNEMNEM
jgi:hypothetical protein